MSTRTNADSRADAKANFNEQVAKSNSEKPAFITQEMLDKASRASARGAGSSSKASSVAVKDSENPPRLSRLQTYLPPRCSRLFQRGPKSGMPVDAQEPLWKSIFTIGCVSKPPKVE